MRVVRPIRIMGDMAYVPLTQGYVAVADAADAAVVSGHNWAAHVVRRKDGSIINVYAERTNRTGGRKERVAMHRAILGVSAGVLVDHKDCDGLNNRRGNLREASSAQNSANRRLNISSTTGIKGVKAHRPGKWVARISVKGKLLHIGIFDSDTAAAEAYAIASRKHHGEFGRLK